jgi:hypothetical protein
MSLPAEPFHPADPNAPAAPSAAKDPLPPYSECSDEEKARRDAITDLLFPIGSPMRMTMAYAKAKDEEAAIPWWNFAAKRRANDTADILGAVVTASVLSRRR